VGTTGPHVTVVRNETQKAAKSLDFGGRFHIEDCLDLFLPRLDTGRRKPMAEEVRFFDGPFALARIDAESIVLQASEDLVESGHVSFERVAEDGDIIDVDFDVVDSAKNAFHNLLSDIGRLRNAHGETIATVQSGSAPARLNHRDSRVVRSFFHAPHSPRIRVQRVGLHWWLL